MPIGLHIAVDVVDVRLDTPLATDRFLVDTNVWYWMTYSQASHSAKSYQVSHYPAYLDQARRTGAELLYCTLSLPELMHIIERSEYDIFQASSPTIAISAKEFRHNYLQERAWCLAEITSAWSQVTNIAKPLELVINSAMTEAAITDLATIELDGYDLFILEAMRTRGITQIITDDGDFATVQGLQVFTANRNVIDQAAKQGKLLTR